MKNEIDEVDDIVNTLYEAKRQYYLTGESKFSDAEFDEMEDSLVKLYPQHPYLNEVGVENNVSADKKIKHNIKMLSCSKVKNIKDLFKWIDWLGLNKDEEIIIEPKIDGLSATCYYNNGKLVYVATRGNGEYGQDITHVCKYIESIPLCVEYKHPFEVRGELYIPKNTSYSIENKSLRNSCVGLISRKTNLRDLKYVKFIAYELIGLGNLKLCENLMWMKQQSFTTVIQFKTKNRDEIKKYYDEYLSSLRGEWLYETDGLLLKVNNTSLYKDINSRKIVSRYNHYNMAIKPPPICKNSVLRNIEWNINKLGYLIPVAEFDPITLGNVNISRATLYNVNRIKDMSLNIGDVIAIDRANDVIPYIKHVVQHCKNNYNSYETIIPKRCYSCNEILQIEGINLKCSNKLCPELNIQNILHWLKIFDITNIGVSSVRALYNNDKIRTPADLYRLTVNDLCCVDGFADKKIIDLLNKINNKRTVNIIDFVSALGIQSVTKKSILKLNIKSIDDFLYFKDDDCAIGRNLICWRNDNVDLINELLDVLTIRSL